MANFTQGYFIDTGSDNIVLLEPTENTSGAEDVHCLGLCILQGRPSWRGLRILGDGTVLNSLTEWKDDIIQRFKTTLCQRDTIRPEVFVMASKPGEGLKVALALAMLCSIQVALGHMASDPRGPSNSNYRFPIHFWQRGFILTSEITSYNSRRHHQDARKSRIHLWQQDKFVWRPFPFAPSKEGWVHEIVNLVGMMEFPDNIKEYLMSIRHSIIPLRMGNILHAQPYNPHRFARQFGFDQHYARDADNIMRIVLEKPTRLYALWWRSMLEPYFSSRIDSLVEHELNPKKTHKSIPRSLPVESRRGARDISPFAHTAKQNLLAESAHLSLQQTHEIPDVPNSSLLVHNRFEPNIVNDRTAAKRGFPKTRAAETRKDPMLMHQWPRRALQEKKNTYSPMIGNEVEPPLVLASFEEGGRNHNLLIDARAIVADLQGIASPREIEDSIPSRYNPEVDYEPTLSVVVVDEDVSDTNMAVSAHTLIGDESKDNVDDTATTRDLEIKSVNGDDPIAAVGVLSKNMLLKEGSGTGKALTLLDQQRQKVEDLERTLAAARAKEAKLNDEVNTINEYIFRLDTGKDKAVAMMEGAIEEFGATEGSHSMTMEFNHLSNLIKDFEHHCKEFDL
uniref:Aminotransferase-like plant mobile domain-containing protein n=1 Tax=Ananas comosus var. bracteatus TaxID=296719 RepID=A0A6V7QLM3_ANACO|nr:unnamed protein product [Ananas comosus var. bracteatus]